MSRLRKKNQDSQKNSSDKPAYSRWMMQGFIFSVAVNIALLTSLVFNAVKKREPQVKLSSQQLAQKKGVISLKKTLVELSGKSFQELVAQLENTDHIEDGFSQRDIALSILSHQYNLDVNRALLGQNIALRFVAIQPANGQSYEYPIFSAVSDSQYKLIQTFIQNEKWPLTSFGLFKKLAQGVNDETLKNAFYLTKEFMYVDALFCSLAISKEVLLNIILQGSWETLNSFISEHHQVQEFSNPLRIQFLSQYLDSASEYAARLILEIDAPYALKKLTDSQILALLGLLEHKSSLSENFAVHLALGNRSDTVRQEACRLLYHYSGQTSPDPFSYQEAMLFVSNKYHMDSIEPLMSTIADVKAVPEVETKSSAKKLYIVQEGDNLWKIAKKNHVGVDKLKKTNNLNSDLIRVGTTLVIP